MSFSAGSFIKDTGKSVIDRLVDNVVKNTTSGLAQSSQLLAKSTAESLIKSGSTYQNAEALSSLKTSEVTSGAADEFFAIAGKSTSRSAAANISKLRRAGEDTDIEGYLQEVNPSTKINKKRDSREILSVR